VANGQLRPDVEFCVAVVTAANDIVSSRCRKTQTDDDNIVIVYAQEAFEIPRLGRHSQPATPELVGFL